MLYGPFDECQRKGNWKHADCRWMVQPVVTDMGQLAFTSDDRLFDGECVRFTGRDGRRRILCGVTIYALKHRHPDLPMEGLLPAELFLEAYDRYVIEIHDIARHKYAEGRTEPDGPVEIMVHDEDWR